MERRRIARGGIGWERDEGRPDLPRCSSCIQAAAGRDPHAVVLVLVRLLLDLVEFEGQGLAAELGLLELCLAGRLVGAVLLDGLLQLLQLLLLLSQPSDRRKAWKITWAALRASIGELTVELS